jgi:peptidyl-prolyl cis-trans isomerase A (cyclophilin A)
VLVFETPAGALDLQQRIAAHAALLRNLAAPIDSAPVLVHVETSLGSLVVEVYPDRAPITATNFLRYVDGGDYDGAKFYRVVRLDNQSQSKILIEVVQGGLSAEGMLDGSGEGLGLYPPIAHETTEQTGLRHIDGFISMARDKPGSASSEFFISVGENPALDFGGLRNPDGQGFAVFGRVVEGMAIVRDIQALPADTPLPEVLAIVQGQVLEEPVLIISMKRR